MRRILTGPLVVLFIACAPLHAQQAQDWPNLQRYRQANDSLRPPAPNERRVVFMGNSITDSWAKFFPQMFPGKPYIGRGISGQTTPQMLCSPRRRAPAGGRCDSAGTNDIAGNTGPSTPEMIKII
jgi:hypothetical protein